MIRPTFALLAASMALVGCANNILSDDHIRQDTALVLNQPASAIAISDRRFDGSTNTYYMARTPRGTFRCVIDGGTVMTMGLTNPPQCTRQ